MTSPLTGGLVRLTLAYTCYFAAGFGFAHALREGYVPHITISLSTVSTLGLGYLLTYLDQGYKRDGYKCAWYQRLPLWSLMLKRLPATVTTSKTSPLEKDEQYIFAAFPHGTCTVQHMTTMTDACSFLSKTHTGDRRDLAASILFFVPVVREILLFLGNVDAGRSTAIHNLRQGRSLLIFVGGEKEQLLTTPNEHKVFIRQRLGFVKLAMQFGTSIVPIYAFGENELYYVSDFLLGPRKWLQKHFHIGLPICCGPLGPLAPIWPLARPLDVCIGDPIKVPLRSREEQTIEEIEAIHELVIRGLEAIFEREKGRHGIAPEVKLTVL